MPVTVPVEPTEAYMPAELKVPPDVGSLNEVVPPLAHTAKVPLIAPGDSHIVTGVATFHRSPASAALLWFTAFSTPYITTLPVPADGAVQVMDVT